MSHYAHAIARQWLDTSDAAETPPPGFARDVLRFASMHDIGKVGVPDSILLKPGYLSDVERLEMRMHTLIGGSVLRACAVQLPGGSRVMFKGTEERRGGKERGSKGKDR